MTHLTPTTFILVRHAQMQAGGHNGGLSETGRRQAAAVVTAIDWTRVDHIIASPLRRTVETAEAFGREFELDARLAEFEFGEAWPSPQETNAERLNLVLWRAEHGRPGGDTLGGFQARVAAAFDGLAMRHGGRRLVVVTHSGTIDAALRWAYNLPHDADWMTEADCVNASITEIAHWPRGRFAPELADAGTGRLLVPGAPRYWLVRRVADRHHLPTELVTDM